MLSVRKILQSWSIYLGGNVHTRLLIEERMKICEDCPHMQAISPMGQVLLNTLVEGVSFKCAKCTCFLEVKAANPEMNCPLGKWKIHG